jgi:hypothetical protein
MSKESFVKSWRRFDLPTFKQGSIDKSSSPVVAGWEPLDPPNEVRWEPLDVPDEVGEDAVYDQALLKEFPETFKRDAEKVSQMLNQLERNPEAEIKKPEVRTFVEQLAASGLIGGVFLKARMKKLFHDAADPKDCLPSWLQADFLKKNQLKAEAGALNREELAEMCVNFDALVQGLPYRDLPHGRYFELSAVPQLSPEPRQYKYYVERFMLRDALKTGALAKAIQELRGLQLGLECKLFEGDRLVMYGKTDVASARILTEVLLKYGIKGRGPAQDVWELKQDSKGRAELKVTYSNDSALGDAGKLPDALEYSLKKYTPQAFFEWYLRVCSFTGKVPTEPYKTAFIYLIGTIPEVDRLHVLQEAAALAGYPVVLSAKRILV